MLAVDFSLVVDEDEPDTVNIWIDTASDDILGVKLWITDNDDNAIPIADTSGLDSPLEDGARHYLHFC